MPAFTAGSLTSSALYTTIPDCPAFFGKSWASRKSEAAWLSEPGRVKSLTNWPPNAPLSATSAARTPPQPTRTSQRRR
jgi:hypothetical protein